MSNTSPMSNTRRLLLLLGPLAGVYRGAEANDVVRD